MGSSRPPVSSPSSSKDVLPTPQALLRQCGVCDHFLLRPGKHSGASDEQGSGDIDGGGLGLSDVPLFVAALLGPTPEGVCTGDINGAADLNGDDVQLFVSLVSAPWRAHSRGPCGA